MFSCGRPLLFGSFIINILCTCQPCLSNCVSKPPNPSCPAEILLSNLNISLSSCNPLLAAIYQSQVNPDTRLHPPPPCLHSRLHHCLLLIRTHVFGFASTDFYSSSLQRIPSPFQGLFHLLCVHRLLKVLLPPS